MDERQFQVQQRVAKKLSALRKSLTGEERQVLDELITGQIAEVDSHKMAKSAAPAPDEVEAHQMSTAADPTRVPQADRRAQARLKYDPDKDEYRAEK